ncbi:DoxX family membrane protein [Rubrobacter taiwanensis]|jgi:putative oxidoreductase|uniref:DoxX family membrane protein n=1 Tax=Rubrobacter taiwanensis TaxID=185139 RepID=A0A4R1BFE4_9ACTN|nr:MauE/DoxX family redox-associated membrane protein [Rubrobacter taiwanensis]TCJ15881.1 DoxX family membrane protein [Rubrobacter taiwanensis]
MKSYKRPRSVKSLLAGSYVTLASRLLLGGLFLYAGTVKALDPGALAASIRTYELNLPEWFVTLAAHALPWLEVLFGFYLLVGLFTRFAAAAVSGMMAIFILALLQGAIRGLEIDCGCFGATADGEPSNLWLSFLRDVGLLALGLHLVYASAGRFSLDALLSRLRTS